MTNMFKDSWCPFRFLSVKLSIQFISLLADWQLYFLGISVLHFFIYPDPIILWIGVFSIGSTIWTLVPQLVVLLGKSKLWRLAGGSMLLRRALGVYYLTPCPVLSLSALCLRPKIRASGFLLLSLCLLLAAVPPHHDGLLSFWDCKPK